MRYEWCYAAEVVLREDSMLPYCNLVTDRPTFENINGRNQRYNWGQARNIDGVQYQTFCGPNNLGCDDSGSTNWNGGSLRHREGHFCYKKYK